MVIQEILDAISPASFAYQLAQDYSTTRSFYRKHYNYIWKKSSSLDPKIFFEGRFKYYKDYYSQRDKDREIEDAINNQKNVLILGRPLAGKSRAVFEVLKKIEKSCFILKPRPVDIEIENYTFPKLPGNMKKVMFLDDLDIFAEKRNFDYLFEVARENKLIIVATCRSGVEYDLLEHKLPHNLTIESIFDKVVTYDKVSNSDAQLIASKLNIKWEEAEFDGTIGSLIMKLGPMKTRYKALPQEEKDILRIFRRLYCAGISEEGQLFFVDTIQTFAKAKGITNSTNDLNHLLDSLISKKFIENPVVNVYQVEEIYLERVFDFGEKVQRISILSDVIETFSGKPVILNKIGNRASSLASIRVEKRDFAKTAIKAYETALKIFTSDKKPLDYAQTQNYLGDAYQELAEVEDKKENLIKAIKAYEAALEIFERENMQYYAKTQNNLGIACLKLAAVEDKNLNLLKAIRAHEAALGTFIPDNLPQDYAKTQNNLGNAYTELAEVEDKKENLIKAIKAYEAALEKFERENMQYDYAQTQNNLGISYTELAKVEDKKDNLIKAIKACESALKYRTLEKLPLDYAKTQNNLGIAFRNFAEVENKKDNLVKAIKAHEAAVDIFKPDKLPLYYANTNNNLGNDYRDLAEVEDKKDNLIKAIKACEEALNIFKSEEMQDNVQSLRKDIDILQTQLHED